MGTRAVSDILNVQGRFLRSTHLERDFEDPAAMAGYVVTNHARQHFKQLSEALAPLSGRRAWRITGDYGSGKSSFALALAHLLSASSEDLPASLHDVINTSGHRLPRLLPVLVTGSSAPLATCLLRALRDAIISRFQRLQPSLLDHPLCAEIDAALVKAASRGTQDGQEVIGLVRRASQEVRSSGIASGLLIILDEMGKFLEYAIIHPDRQDVYFLQGLAEMAMRSGAAPILLIGLLHQGFQAYADGLSSAGQKEWEKVSGRFDEILFTLPLEQTTEMIVQALGVTQYLLPGVLRREAEEDMRATLSLGWYGSGTSYALVDAAPGLYPLHPTVVPALVRLFSNFGQNERSLFSFLTSTDHFSVGDFAQQPLEEAGFYRLHNLYDYARAALGHQMSHQSYRNHWSYIDGVIQSFPAESDLDVRVLKTVGLLNLLDLQSLLPTAEAVSLAVVGGEHAPAEGEAVQAALTKLQHGKKALYNRGPTGGYCLWPFTSVNLERAYNDAQRAVGTLETVVPHLKDHLILRPIVARRHYVETGNLRHFHVSYGRLSEIEIAIKENTRKYAAGGALEADGFIYILLCESENERETALAFARSAATFGSPAVIVGVSPPLIGMSGLIQEVRYWHWILKNTPELSNDTYAAEEVDRQILAAEQALHVRVQSRIGLERSAGGTYELEWFWRGAPVRLRDGRHLLEFLSMVCDETFASAPRVPNELVNRRSLSSAAAAARMRLIERILVDEAAPYLGMDPKRKPPEMSMYLSVVRAAGLHKRLNATDEPTEHWVFALPDDNQLSDPCRVRPSLLLLERMLEAQPDARVPVSDLFAELRHAPYGIRDGLLPLLLAIFHRIHRHEVAMYEDGAFIREVEGDVFMRLIKAPTTFEMQLCRIVGVRNALFDQLARLLRVEAQHETPHLLDVVVPLCEVAGQLPEYTLFTNQLSPRTNGVRDALVKTEDPSRLLFTELPKALGFEPFQPTNLSEAQTVDGFIQAIRVALDELRLAYTALLDRVAHEIRRTFSLAQNSPTEFREEISARARQILISVSEYRLKALCLRLADPALPMTEWLESIGSLICAKPPSRWRDLDCDRFSNDLTQLAQRFLRVESVTFAGQPQRDTGRAVRLVLTQPDGQEVEQVLYVTPDEEGLTADLVERLSTIIVDGDRVALAAAAQVLWERIGRGQAR